MKLLLHSTQECRIVVRNDRQYQSCGRTRKSLQERRLLQSNHDHIQPGAVTGNKTRFHSSGLWRRQEYGVVFEALTLRTNADLARGDSSYLRLESAYRELFSEKIFGRWWMLLSRNRGLKFLVRRFG